MINRKLSYFQFDAIRNSNKKHVNSGNLFIGAIFKEVNKISRVIKIQFAMIKNSNNNNNQFFLSVVQLFH